MTLSSPRRVVVEELESQLSNKASQLCLDLRGDPALQLRHSYYGKPDEHTVYLAPLRLRTICLCSLVANYIIEEEWRGLLKVMLWERIEKLAFVDQSVPLVLIKNTKPANLLFILETNYFGRTPNEFFGRLAQLGLEERLSFRRWNGQQGTVVWPKRKRGYNDHGSSRPNHKWKPQFDWTLTELHNELERMKETATVDLPDFLWGWYT